jgi:anti-sigma factor ChrR (cupin superfamily)
LRKPLERQQEESGQVTSVVRYEPGSELKAHHHPSGEEIFVLEGEFSDDYGRYPAGTYIRNPAGSSHRLFSENGCTIFVKLNQFADGDSERVVVDTNKTQWLPGQGGLKVMPLHQFAGQNTALVKWPAGERFQPHRHMGGEEIFVLLGTFKDEHGSYPKGSWLRSPHTSQHFPFTDEETVILVKVGHM